VGLASSELSSEVERLRALSKDDLIQKIQELEKSKDAEVTKLVELIRLLRRRHFGKSSEKLKPETQLGLFNEAEELAATNPEKDEEAEEVVHVPAHDRKKPKRKRLPPDLPREDQVIELSEAERICPNDGKLMFEIGEEVSEKLDVIPLQLKVKRTIRKKYGCECESCVKIAPNPPQAIPKSLATAGSLAAIATWKYADALPLYRIEGIFHRHGIEISRGTLAFWMIRTGTLLQPLINLLNDELIASSYLQMDETRVQVLKEEGKRAESLSYMWVRARPGKDPIILFDYDPTRSGTVPVKLLEGFSGHLQVDGYGGYNEVTSRADVSRGGCFMHLRRKFFEAAKVSKKDGLGKHGLKYIVGLYAVEEECRELPFETRYLERQKHSKPILDEMHNWILETKPKVPPQTAIGRAFSYAHDEWQYLISFMNDGRYEMDNGFVENIIRPFAIGRKNWLFSDTVDGAIASSNIYSMVVTAKANGLEPYAYLRFILERLPLAKTVEDFEKLLPAAVKLVLLKDLLK